MEQQLKELQEQLRELSLTVQHMGNRRTPPRYRPEDYDSDDSSHAGDYNPYGNRNRNTRGHSDIKVDIPEYDGRLDPDAFIEWLRTVERVFDYKQTTEEQKVKLVALKLRKYVSTWWANVCSKREIQGKEKVQTWSKMKKMMKNKFMPSYYVQASFSQLHALKQGTNTAEEYSRDFEHLIMKCNVDPDDPQTLVRYLGGLEHRIAHVIELQPYSTLEELSILAHKVDTQHMLQGKVEITTPVSKIPISAHHPLSNPPQKPTPSKSIDFPEGSNTNSRHPRRCFRCQGAGHIASECPNKRVITLSEFNALTAPKYDEEPIQQCTIEEVEIGPDEGDCLMVQRVLSGITTQGDNMQRETLFRTRCTIRKKVCSLVVDGGSCTNVASQTMITKLNLPTEPHPFPYDIQWLNQSKGIRVPNRVLLPFSIGEEYKDEIWCDVIPMDVSHVLLGCPWLFDLRVLHDGYKNTYTFVKNGKKVTLLPSTPMCTSDHRTLITLDIPTDMICTRSATNCRGGTNSHAAIVGDFQHARKPKFRVLKSLRANFLQDREDDSNQWQVFKVEGGVMAILIQWKT